MLNPYTVSVLRIEYARKLVTARSKGSIFPIAAKPYRKRRTKAFSTCSSKEDRSKTNFFTARDSILFNKRLLSRR